MRDKVDDDVEYASLQKLHAMQVSSQAPALALKGQLVASVWRGV